MVVAAAAILFGVYEYYLKRMPTVDQGTASTQAISLTGVRGDLLQIAQAERAYIALNGHCASLDELLSSNSVTMSRPERDGYSYVVECSGGSFSATARHAPAPAGSPIRYPSFAIDQTLQVREIKKSTSAWVWSSRASAPARYRGFPASPLFAPELFRQLSRTYC